MAPSVALDMASDFSVPIKTPSTSSPTLRTLLLSPPSLSSHPSALNNILEAHDRSATDIQMLDRLSLSLVTLPDSTYDVILILTDADNTRSESTRLLSREIFESIVKALKPGGRLKSQDGSFAASVNGEERREAILAGLLVQGTNDVVKPNYEATESIPLRFGGKNSEGGGVSTTSAMGTGAVSLNINGKRANVPPETKQPAGVGFVDFSDDLDEPIDDDEDLIDEDTLLDEEDLARPIVQRMSISISQSSQIST